MTTYYIDPAGNDTTGDGSIGNPWLTLDKAITSSIDNDIISVNDGTYSSFVSLGNSGYFGSVNTQDITIQATNGDSSLVVFDLLLVDTALIIKNSVVSINNITIKNITRAGRSAIWAGQSGHSSAGVVTFTNCVFKNLTAFNNPYQDAGIFNGGPGSPTTQFVFIGCVFNDMGNQPLSRIFASGGNDWNVTLTNCTIHQSIAVAAVFQRDNVNVKNCIFHNDSGTNIELSETASPVNTEYDYSCAFTNWTQIPSGTANITTDPLFADADNDNFNLRPTSPCIDTGVLI